MDSSTVQDGASRVKEECDPDRATELMRLSEQWVDAGCVRADPLLAEERRTLVASYASLREAIDRAPLTAPATPPR
jgi:hypothetical protein